MRLRCARASLRSSALNSERGRLRDGADWGGGDAADDEDGEDAESAAGSMNAEAGIAVVVVGGGWMVVDGGGQADG